MGLGHTHAVGTAAGGQRRRLIVVLVLTLAVLAAEVVGAVMSGSLGLLVNLVSLGVLHRGRGASLNVRGAYLEVLADALGSVAVIVAAVVIMLTGWTPADILASVVIGFLVLPR